MVSKLPSVSTSTVTDMQRASFQPERALRALARLSVDPRGHGLYGIRSSQVT
jgi:hypothetical protein